MIITAELCQGRQGEGAIPPHRGNSQVSSTCGQGLVSLAQLIDSFPSVGVESRICLECSCLQHSCQMGGGAREGGSDGAVFKPQQRNGAREIAGYGTRCILGMLGGCSAASLNPVSEVLSENPAHTMDAQ